MENSELMNEAEAGAYWNENATVWTKLAREGYDVYRDQVNTPGFFSFLPDVSNSIAFSAIQNAKRGVRDETARREREGSSKYELRMTK